MLQKWLLRLSSRICFMADSLYFFSLHSGFTLGKWLPSFVQYSSNLNCFGDQNTNKNTKTYTKWLKLLSRVLNMPIELKGQNYYSKVFKRINYKLSNSTFWVVITWHRVFHVIDMPDLCMASTTLISWPGLFNVNHDPKLFIEFKGLSSWPVSFMSSTTLSC